MDIFGPENAKLKDLSLHFDEFEGAKIYYLKAVYEYEDERGIYELTVPHMELPVDDNCILTTEHASISTRCMNVWANIGFGNLRVKNDDDVPYFIKELKKKTHKMTVEEIEKKLGYKIEIVSEKEKGGVLRDDCRSIIGGSKF